MERKVKDLVDLAVAAGATEQITRLEGSSLAQDMRKEFKEAEPTEILRTLCTGWKGLKLGEIDANAFQKVVKASFVADRALTMKMLVTLSALIFESMRREDTDIMPSVDEIDILADAFVEIGGLVLLEAAGAIPPQQL